MPGQTNPASNGTDLVILDRIAEAVTSPNAVIVFCAAIVLVAIAAVLWLVFRSRPVLIGLLRATGELRSYANESRFAGGFEKFNDWAKKDALLGHSWSEFGETLILPSSDDVQVIKNTRVSADYFNLENIVAPRLNLRFYAAFPSYLTALGILGTFIGLLFAIIHSSKELGVPTNDIATVLKSLFNAASLAFGTSVTGIFTSIIFSVIEKHRIHIIQKNISEWNHTLDGRLEFVTLENLSSDHLNEAKLQTLQLQKFNTDLAVSIAGALEEKIAGKLGPVLDKLVESIEGIRRDRGETNQEMLENIVVEFKNALAEGTGTEMSRISSTLQELDSTIRGSMEALSTSQSDMQQRTSEIADHVGKVIEQSGTALHTQMKLSIEEISSQLTEASAASAAHLRNAGSQMSESLGESISRLEASINRFDNTTQLTERLTTSTAQSIANLRDLADTLRDVFNSFSGLVSPLQSTSESLQASVQQSKQVMEQVKTLSEIMGSLGDSMTTSQQQMSESWREYQTRFESIDVALKSVFEEITTGLTKYTEQIKGFVTQLDEQFAKAVGDLGGAIGELSATTEEFSDIVDKIQKKLIIMPARPYQPQSDRQDYMISISDLMAGLLFIFIILLMFFAMRMYRAERQLTTTRDTQKEILEAIKNTMPKISDCDSIEIDPQNGILHLPTCVEFAQCEYEIPRRSLIADYIDSLAVVLYSVLRDYTKADTEHRVHAVLIEGHTDPEPVKDDCKKDKNLKRKPVEDNWDLSAFRAISVFKRLISVNDGQLTTLRNENDHQLFGVAGYASSRRRAALRRKPDSLLTDEDMKKLRRIDILVLMTPLKSESDQIVNIQQ